jgi:hypothetical protein
MNPSLVRKLHRWLGLTFSLGALLSSGSGVLHNVMTWTQPPPPPVQPSGARLEITAIKVPLAAALAAVPGTNGVKAVNLRVINGEPWYVIYTLNSRIANYVSAVTGQLNPAQDEVFAREIAMKNLNGMAVKKTDYLTAFNHEYINIFRILPVYRFDADDGRGTRVYVSTMTESVTRATDDQKQFEANVFSKLHKLQFIPSKFWRDVVLTTMTFGIFCAALAGIILFILTSPRQKLLPNKP